MKDRSFRTTPKQRGGVTGKGFLPGQSGNPGGRPRGERGVLQAMYGEGGEKLYSRLEKLREHPGTAVRVKAQIDFFLIERLHGRVQSRLEGDKGPSLADLLFDLARPEDIVRR